MSWHWKERSDKIAIRRIEEKEGRPFDEIVEENWKKYEKERRIKNK